MSSTTAVAGEPDRRKRADTDRRVLHRGDDGRRSEDAPATHNALPPAAPAAAPATDGNPTSYLVILGVLFAVLWAAIVYANVALNPMVYRQSAHTEVARAFVAGQNYGVFDLNIDMRGLRREHIRLLTETPDVVVLGASHWQEGSADLVPHRKFYNAHVHRDYYEDFLAVTEMLVANDRLPQTMIISVRDLTFAPVAARTDDLWRTGLRDYRAMARRLGIRPHTWWETFAIRPWLDLMSLPTAFDLARHLVTAAERPGPMAADASATLDVLHKEGFIRWSAAHDALFTAERAAELADSDLEELRYQHIDIDPAGLEALDRLLAYLVERDVRVVLVHPPYNPRFYDGIVDTTFGRDLKRVAEKTAGLAKAHGVAVYGSFDPNVVGCDKSMFIDSHHSRQACLAKIIAEIPNL